MRGTSWPRSNNMTIVDRPSTPCRQDRQRRQREVEQMAGFCGCSENKRYCDGVRIVLSLGTAQRPVIHISSVGGGKPANSPEFSAPGTGLYDWSASGGIR